MRTHCWQSSVLVVILFLARRIAGGATVYVVTGAGSLFNGVYEEKREPELHYKKLVEANSYGYYDFLYKGSQHGNTWILGYGDTLSAALAQYSNFRKYAHPLHVKEGIITEKVFPVFSESFFWTCFGLVMYIWELMVVTEKFAFQM